MLRFLVRLFPRRFRFRFEDEMHDALREDHAASRAEGTVAVARFWSRSLPGALLAATREHVTGAFGDSRYAARRLLKRPLFCVSAIVSLAIGLAATTTVVSVFRAVFVHPIPGIGQPAQLVNVKPISRLDEAFELATYRYFDAVRTSTSSLQSLAGFHGTRLSLTADPKHDPEIVTAQIVTASYFSTLRLRPSRGRFFDAQDEERSAAVAVISTWLWRNRLNEAELGATIRLNDSAYTVVGILPEGFRGHFKAFNADIFIPTAATASAGMPGRNDPDRHWVEMIGRLREGAVLETVVSELAVVGSQLGSEFPEGRDLELVADANDGIEADLRGGALVLLLGLLGVSGFVLVIACLNVASVLLGDVGARRREFSVRRALGAPPAELARHLLVESLLIAVGAAALAAPIALLAARQAASSLATIDASMSLELGPQVGTVTAVVLLALGSALVAGALPALQAARTSESETLRSSRSAAGRHSRFFRGLVVAQVFLSFTILLSASLFLRSLQRATRLDPGFETADVLVVGVAPGLVGIDEKEARRLMAEVRDRVEEAATIDSAALTSRVPLSLGSRFFPNTLEVAVPGVEPPPERDGFTIEHAIVSTGYFSTLGIEISRGRAFESIDRMDSAPTAIVNEAFAERFYPRRDAVGARIEIDGQALRVIGVAAQSRYRTLDEEARPFLYLPFSQRPSARAALLMRTLAPIPAAEEARAAIRRIVPGLPLQDLEPLERRLATSFLPQRTAAVVSATLGVVGLFLAALGLYGVLGTWVQRRTHEIGVRVSLGARPLEIRGLVLRQGLTTCAVGIGLGIPVAYGVSKLFSSLLLDVGLADLPSYGGVTLLLLLVATIASVLPARRAARADPIEALRQDG